VGSYRLDTRPFDIRSREWGHGPTRWRSGHRVPCLIVDPLEPRMPLSARHHALAVAQIAVALSATLAHAQMNRDTSTVFTPTTYAVADFYRSIKFAGASNEGHVAVSYDARPVKEKVLDAFLEAPYSVILPVMATLLIRVPTVMAACVRRKNGGAWGTADGGSCASAIPESKPKNHPHTSETSPTVRIWSPPYSTSKLIPLKLSLTEGHTSLGKT